MLTLILTLLFNFIFPHAELKKIAEKIWKNECGETLEGLTFWNSGENFASLGIGHFIWYPEKAPSSFKETFPELLQFLKKSGVILPPWLEESKGCPWRAKQEFVENLNDPKMIQLRSILFETIDLQALFIARRLEEALPKMVEGLCDEEKDHVIANFYQLAEDPRGLYALMDYLNFKGEGISPLERYQGKGWGLLQVLQLMPRDSERPLEAFTFAAVKMLTERVENSPSERNEVKWLNGWLLRVSSYLLD